MTSKPELSQAVLDAQPFSYCILDFYPVDITFDKLEKAQTLGNRESPKQPKKYKVVKKLGLFNNIKFLLLSLLYFLSSL